MIAKKEPTTQDLINIDAHLLARGCKVLRLTKEGLLFEKESVDKIMTGNPEPIMSRDEALKLRAHLLRTLKVAAD